MLSTASTPASALYNFRLLEALRSDDPGKVQPFLDELRPSTMSANGMQDEMKAGKLLGMAVKVASGQSCFSRMCLPCLTRCSANSLPDHHVFGGIVAEPTGGSWFFDYRATRREREWTF